MVDLEGDWHGRYTTYLCGVMLARWTQILPLWGMLARSIHNLPLWGDVGTVDTDLTSVGMLARWTQILPLWGMLARWTHNLPLWWCWHGGHRSYLCGGCWHGGHTTYLYQRDWHGGHTTCLYGGDGTVETDLTSIGDIGTVDTQLTSMGDVGTVDTQLTSMGDVGTVDRLAISLILFSLVLSSAFCFTDWNNQTICYQLLGNGCQVKISGWTFHYVYPIAENGSLISNDNVFLSLKTFKPIFFPLSQLIIFVKIVEVTQMNKNLP